MWLPGSASSSDLEGISISLLDAFSLSNSVMNSNLRQGHPDTRSHLGQVRIGFQGWEEAWHSWRSNRLMSISFKDGRFLNKSLQYKEYIEDIAYQELVCSLAHPEFEYIPYLLLPDKGKTTSIDQLASYFTLIEQSGPNGRISREVKSISSLFMPLNKWTAP